MISEFLGSIPRSNRGAACTVPTRRSRAGSEDHALQRFEPHRGIGYQRRARR
jgi:hypothetical protein